MRKLIDESINGGVVGGQGNDAAGKVAQSRLNALVDSEPGPSKPIVFVFGDIVFVKCNDVPFDALNNPFNKSMRMSMEKKNKQSRHTYNEDAEQVFHQQSLLDLCAGTREIILGIQSEWRVLLRRRSSRLLICCRGRRDASR